MTWELWAGVGAVVAAFMAFVVSIYNFVQFHLAWRSLIPKLRVDPELRRKLRSAPASVLSMDAATLEEVAALIEKEADTLTRAQRKQILIFLRQPDRVARKYFIRSLLASAHLRPST